MDQLSFVLFFFSGGAAIGVAFAKSIMSGNMHTSLRLHVHPRTRRRLQGLC
jgi:hypothetical protein